MQPPCPGCVLLIGLVRRGPGVPGGRKPGQDAACLSPEPRRRCRGAQAGARGAWLNPYLPPTAVVPHSKDRQSLRTCWVWEGAKRALRSPGHKCQPQGPEGLSPAPSPTPHRPQLQRSWSEPQPGKESSRMSCESRHRLQTAGTGDAQFPVPLESWGGRMVGIDRPVSPVPVCLPRGQSSRHSRWCFCRCAFFSALRATLAASRKTSSTFSRNLAEHSRYRAACIC